jgi:hypothetical protein
MKVCVNCLHRLRHEDLLDRETQNMEASRTSLGLEGVCFRYYTCPRCGHDHVFLETFQLPGESRQDLLDRKEALAQTVQEVGAERTTVLVVEQGV